jgi:DNA polymerase III subunit delta'
MAETEQDDDALLVPASGPLLERAQVAWLAPARERLAAQMDAGRLPHGLLLAGAPGTGQAEIASWAAARLLCRASGSAKPCGACADCRLFAAGSHPDFHWVGVLADKKEISIDQLRALSASLSLRSYRGGGKVAVISPADAMNPKAMNALLKTLEEPAAETYLILAVQRMDRIARTIQSRCMRIAMPKAGEAEALEWLRRHGGGAEAQALLALAGGAPFLAAELAEAGLGSLDAEMHDAIAAATEGRLDVVAFAEASARNAPAARLAWLESWLTRSLKEAALASDLVNNNRLPWLQPPGLDTKIRAGYGFLDQLREARRQVGGPLNMQLLFEGLTVALVGLVGRRANHSGENTA